MFRHAMHLTGLVLTLGLPETCPAATLQVPASHATLQAALAAAAHGDEIVVANGAYSGDGFRDLSFQGKAIRVRSYGGAARCILNCGGSAGAWHRGFTFSGGEGATSILEGFTITNGYVEGYGGAIYCSSSSPSIRHCVFTSNTAGNGGAVYVNQGAPALDGCTFSHNETTSSGGGGGALKLYYADGAVIRNCSFSNNASIWGGAVIVHYGTARLEQCTLEDNAAGGYGGGLSVNAGDAAIDQCVIRGNAARNGGGGVLFYDGATGQLAGCELADNQAPYGGGVACSNSDPNLVSCTLRRNTAQNYGGGVSLDGDSTLRLTDCLLETNTAGDDGGALCTTQSAVTITRCRFTANSSGSYGGAVHDDQSAFTASDSLWDGNQSYHGAALDLCNSSAALRHCTLAGNRAAGSGGAVYSWMNNTLTLTNCILWDNVADGAGQQLALNSSASAQVSYSDLEDGQTAVSVPGGCTLTWGAGNADADPQFLAAGEWEDQGAPDPADDEWMPGCCYVLPGSPCQDTGDGAAVQPDETDIAANDRVLGASVDMGAYESEPTGQLLVTKLTVKAGQTRAAEQDALLLSGALDLTPAQFLAADSIALRIGPQGGILFREDFRQAGKTAKYTFADNAAGVTATFDLDKQTFKMQIKALDLTGLTAPVPVALAAGQWYSYVTVGESIANGNQPVPMQLLIGSADALAVDRAQATQSSGGKVAHLSLTGRIALAHPQDAAALAAAGLAITWGSQEPYTIPAAAFTAQGAAQYLAHKKAAAIDVSSATALFDFDKCTFRLTLKNTNLNWLAGSATFRLQFGGFDRSQDVTF